MIARFDENPAMTLQVIKETKRYGRTDTRTDNVKTVYPLQTKFAGGITKCVKCLWFGFRFYLFFYLFIFLFCFCFFFRLRPVAGDSSYSTAGNV